MLRRTFRNRHAVTNGIGVQVDRNLHSVRKTEGTEASTEIEYFLDEHFTDERMERIYPNAIIVE